MLIELSSQFLDVPMHLCMRLCCPSNRQSVRPSVRSSVFPSQKMCLCPIKSWVLSEKKVINYMRIITFLRDMKFILDKSRFLGLLIKVQCFVCLSLGPYKELFLCPIKPFLGHSIIQMVITKMVDLCLAPKYLKHSRFTSLVWIMNYPMSHKKFYGTKAGSPNNEICVCS